MKEVFALERIRKRYKRLFLFVLNIFLILSCLFMVCSTTVQADENSEDSKVKVGWVILPGLQNYENNKISGYTYDYLMKISEYTGWEYEFIVNDLTTSLEDLETGDVSIVGGLIKSEERLERFDFPQYSYAESYITLYTSANSELKEYEFDEFINIRVGIVRNATVNYELFNEFALENGFTFTPVFYDDVNMLDADVLNGTLDAGMRGAFRSTEDTKILAEFAPTSIYFAITKGNTEILVDLNRAINRIKIDYPYYEIELYKKYFSSSESTVLTNNEKSIINASQTDPIVVGVVDSSAPLFYFDESIKEYEGIAIDMMNLISEKTGIKFSYKSVDISRANSAKTPTEDSPQIVVGVTRMDGITDSRDWYLSNPIINDYLVLVGKQQNNITDNPSTKTLALMEGFAMAENYVKAYMSEYKVVKYANLEECLNAVASGEADASIYVRSCVNYLLQKPKYEKLEIITSYSSSIELVVASFVDENNPLINIINKGLAMITEEEANTISLNYTLMNPYKYTISDTLYEYRFTLVIILVLIIAVIFILSLLYITRRNSLREIKKAYNSEMEALEEAKQASAAKGNFMSRMSHEIRTPLNAIIGYNSIAANDIAQAKNDTQYRQAVMKVSDCLTKSNIASKHLLTIINDVLDMSAIESGKIKINHERFDFKGLINSLTTIFYTQAEVKGIRLEVICDSLTEEWFVGDQLRLNQILTNIISNAIKFTQQGKVVFSIKQTNITDEKVNIHFEINDTGIGMSKEYLTKIWAPFEQENASINRRFGGTGLGLSITKNLVDLMNGVIQVESTVGVGSNFKIDLTFDRTIQPSNSSSYDFSMVNALVVDDDYSTCDYIRMLMERFGAHCDSVTSGELAIKAVSNGMKSNRPYTVCLVDWRMPKMDGLETIKQIRKIAGEEIPIIVVTAYDFSEIVDKAAEVGITKFISKPLFQSSLFDLLANICGAKCEAKIDIKNKEVKFTNKKVLLVEDNEMNMEIAKHILELVGLDVEIAWNGQEAVDKFMKTAPGEYSAMLMDVQMPVMDGLQATRLIRSSKHSDAKIIPIIAMTADAFAENVTEALEAGMNEHIAKPIDLPKLYMTLEKFINNK